MKPKILAVDDAVTMRKMVAFTLRGAGFEVVEAGDGAEALTKVKAQSFDLIITDLNMPNMNGIEFTRAARQHLGARKVPILILTTESELTKKNEARAAGATGWIVKPFEQAQLISVVKRVLPQAAAVR